MARPAVPAAVAALDIGYSLDRSVDVSRFAVARRGDIRQQADVVVRTTAEDRCVEIRIYLEGTDPPTGRLRSDAATAGRRTGRDIEFTGWLGLLQALYEVTEHVPERPTDMP